MRPVRVVIVEGLGRVFCALRQLWVCDDGGGAAHLNDAAAVPRRLAVVERADPHGHLDRRHLEDTPEIGGVKGVFILLVATN